MSLALPRTYLQRRKRHFSRLLCGAHLKKVSRGAYKTEDGTAEAISEHLELETDACLTSFALRWVNPFFFVGDFLDLDPFDFGSSYEGIHRVVECEVELRIDDVLVAGVEDYHELLGLCLLCSGQTLAISFQQDEILFSRLTDNVEFEVFSKTMSGHYKDKLIVV